MVLTCLAHGPLSMSIVKQRVEGQYKSLATFSWKLCLIVQHTGRFYTRRKKKIPPGQIVEYIMLGAGPCALPCST